MANLDSHGLRSVLNKEVPDVNVSRPWAGPHPPVRLQFLDSTFVRDLEKYERPKTPYQQLQKLLDKIKITDARVEVAKAHVWQSFGEYVLQGAVEFLGTELMHTNNEPVQRRIPATHGESGSSDGQWKLAASIHILKPHYSHST
jgi:hypothetical protein